jgi:nitrate/TMAO reductase-like tetraheme cytochrome c subunit
MKRADWIFTIGAIAVIGFFIWLSMFTGQKPTPLSPFAAHKTATTRTECMSCHEPGKEGVVEPIPTDHPQAWKDERFNCTVCHLPPK